MAYSSFLSLKPQLAEFRGGSADNVSEISDSGTGGSMNSAMGSAEELQKVALILNISPDDVTQDRFRVDRRKLEAMLTDGVSEDESANNFFQKIMDDTCTVINWPTRLKIGAKSKKDIESKDLLKCLKTFLITELCKLMKDPHVRVAGKHDNVRLAREKIMQILDTRCNRVTMKLDVSYTDHSHIIGKGGLTIKRVMEETGCHIHFPDSNRSNPMEKSNQVSIAGDMENVEKARARVRALTPLIFSFELPIMSSSHALPNASSPYVVEIQEKYNVQVMLRTRPKLHATLVMVKGHQWEVQATMEATTLLINFMCGNLAQQTLVQMSLEITPMHHQVVMGRAASQLKVIMSNTKTQIMFPDATDPNIPMLKKSNVSITGNIEDVYLARQQLIGSLPLVIMFDLPEDIKEVSNDQLNTLMQNLNVYINIRQKPKLCALSVIIKGIERNANDIYEARRHLLNLQESAIVASIPESYHIPILPGGAETTTHFNPFSPSHQNTIPQSPMGIATPLQNLATNASRNYPLPPLRLGDNSTFTGLSSPQYNPPTPGGYPSPMSPLCLSPSVFTPSWNLITASPQAQTNGNVFQYPGIVPNTTHTYIQSPQQALWGLNNMMSQAQAQVQIQANTSNMMSHIQHPLGIQHYCSSGSSQPHSLSSTGSQPNSLGHLLNVSSQGSSGYHSNFTGSSASLDVHSVSGGDSNSDSNFVSPSVSPIGKGHSPTTPPSNSNNDNNQTNSNDLLNILSEMTDGDRRAPGFEKKTLETIQQSLSPLNDYNKMKLQASKAMKEPCVSDNYRIPTNRWAGYGFSQTSPSHILSPSLQHQNSSVWSNTNANRTPHKLTRPNIVETPCTPPQNETTSPCRYKQLSTMLQEKGLEKYIQLFQSHEVDISTFSSLTDGDLVEIGVTAFGARKRMLMAIAELNKNNTIFSGSAAPGAERKAMRV